MILPIMSSKGSKSSCTLSAYFSWIGRTGTRSKLVFRLKLLIFLIPLMFEHVWNLFQLDFHVNSNNDQKIMVQVEKLRHAHAHSCWMMKFFLVYFPSYTNSLISTNFTNTFFTNTDFTYTRFQNSLIPWLTHIAQVKKSKYLLNNLNSTKFG